MRELLRRRQVPQDNSRKLTEWQPDRLVPRALGSECRDGYPNALLIRANEVPGRVVSFGGCVLASDYGGPPACRADEMIDQRTDIPRHAGRRPGQVVGP